jgi:hypothetical protein
MSSRAGDSRKAIESRPRSTASGIPADEASHADRSDGRHGPLPATFVRLRPVGCTDNAHIVGASPDLPHLVPPPVPLARDILTRDVLRPSSPRSGLSNPDPLHLDHRSFVSSPRRCGDVIQRAPTGLSQSRHSARRQSDTGGEPQPFIRINVALGEERPASSTTVRFLDRDPFPGRAVLDNGPPK